MSSKTPEALQAAAEARLGRRIGPLLDGEEPEGGKRRYYLERLMGFGGMGAVYLAMDDGLRRHIALKIATPDGPDHIARFRREAESMAKVSSENVVIVYDAGSTHDGELYISMERLYGEDLDQALIRKGVFGEEDFTELCEIMLGAANGLAVAHAKKVIHRDIKPGNVFLARKGKKIVAKVLDFGIARINRGPNAGTALTQANTIMGTPQYMAPEQMAGARDVGPAADQYSWGAIFYEALTAEQPYSRKPEGATEDPDWTNLVVWRAGEIQRGFEPYRKTLPVWLHKKHPAIAEMLARVLDPLPENRYENMFEVCRVLAVAANLEVPEDPFNASEHTRMFEAVQLPALAQSPTMDAPPSRPPPANEGSESVIVKVTPDTPPPNIPSPGVVKQPESPRTLEPTTTQRNRLIVPRRFSSRTVTAMVAGCSLFVVMFFAAIRVNRSSSTTVHHDAATFHPVPTALVLVDAGRDLGDASFPTAHRADCDGGIACDLVLVPGEARWNDGGIPLVVEDAAEPEDRHGRHGRRHGHERAPRTETPEQREARELRSAMIAQCCAGRGGDPIAHELHVDHCREPEPACEARDRRPWCRLCGHH